MASLTTILDMVKVMSFAIQEGKMAIHCHAGLGRTGRDNYHQNIRLRVMGSTFLSVDSLKVL